MVDVLDVADRMWQQIRVADSWQRTAPVPVGRLNRRPQPSLPQASQVDARDSMIAEAYAVLALHFADASGKVCAGCLDLARLAPVPCPLSRAALSVVETCGVAAWNEHTARAGPG